LAICTDRAVGFLLGAYYGARDVTASIDNKVVDTFDIRGDTQFLGFVSSGPVSAVTFTSAYELDFFQIYFTGSGAVPEPQTWALLVTGFGIAGAAVRGQRSRVKV
jgi:hypothetical protein